MIVTVVRVELVAQEPISVSAPEASSVKSAADLPVAADPWAAPSFPSRGRWLAPGACDGSARQCRRGPVRRRLRSRRRRRPRRVQAQRTPFLGTSVVPASSSADDGVLVLRQTAVSRWSGPGSGPCARVRRCRLGRVWSSTPSVRTSATWLSTISVARWPPGFHGWGSQSVGAGALAVESIGHASLDLSNRRDLARWLGLSGPQSFDSLDFEQWNWKPAGGHSASTLRWAFRIVGDMRIGDEKKTQKSEITSLRHGEGLRHPRQRLEGCSRAGRVHCAELRTRRLRLDGLRCLRAPRMLHLRDLRLLGECGSGRHRRPTGAQARVRFLTSAVKEAKTATRTHVAIDRFTGGRGAGSCSPRPCSPTDGRHWPWRFRPTSSRGASLLAWAAMDIHDGYVGVGHGTSRGMGSLQLAKPDVVRKHDRLAEAMTARRATSRPWRQLGSAG